MLNINKPFTIEKLHEMNEILKELFSSPIPTAIKVNSHTWNKLEKLPSITKEKMENYAFHGLPVIIDETVDGWELVYRDVIEEES